MFDILQTLGSLFDRVKHPLYVSFREVAMTAVITLTPVWAGVLISLAAIQGQSFSEALRLNTERGDLFILATAIIAPVTLYITIEKGNLPRPLSIHFPGGWLYISILIVLFGVSSLLFAVKRMADSAAITFAASNVEFMYRTSISIYALSVAVAFLVTFIKARIDMTSAEVFREGDDLFISEWTSRDK